MYKSISQVEIYLFIYFKKVTSLKKYKMASAVYLFSSSLSVFITRKITKQTLGFNLNGCLESNSRTF